MSFTCIHSLDSCHMKDLTLITLIKNFQIPEDTHLCVSEEDSSWPSYYLVIRKYFVHCFPLMFHFYITRAFNIFCCFLEF